MSLRHFWLVWIFREPFLSRRISPWILGYGSFFLYQTAYLLYIRRHKNFLLTAFVKGTIIFHFSRISTSLNVTPYFVFLAIYPDFSLLWYDILIHSDKNVENKCLDTTLYLPTAANLQLCYSQTFPVLHRVFF